MLTTKAMDLTEPNDAELVAASLAGSREAFRQITPVPAVARAVALRVRGAVDRIGHRVVPPAAAGQGRLITSQTAGKRSPRR